MTVDSVKKPLGAPTIFQTLGITVDQFIALAKEFPNAAALARHLGVSKRSVQKYSQKYGVSKQPWRPARATASDLGSHTDYGKIDTWLREHPGQKLPFKYAEIAERLGVSMSTVASWLRHRKRRYLDYCIALGDLRKHPVTIHASSGLRVPGRFIREYTLDVDPRRYEVKIAMILSGNRSLTATYSLRSYYALFEKTFKED